MKKRLKIKKSAAISFFSLQIIISFYIISSIQVLANETSQYSHRIDSIKFSAVSAPSEPIDLSWLFSPGNDYLYNYHQDDDMNITISNFYNDKPQHMKQKIKRTGNLKILPINNKQAKLEFDSNIKGTMTTSAGDNKSFSQRLPIYKINNMDQHGNYPSVNPDIDIFIKTTLALPDKQLNIGESSHKIVQATFYVNDKPILVDCKLSIEHGGYVNCNGNTCVQINTRVQIDNFEPPPNLEGEYHPYVFAQGKALFDTKDRKFVQANQAILMIINAKTPPILENEEIAKKLGENPSLVDLDFRLDSFIEFTETETVMEIKTAPNPKKLKKYRSESSSFKPKKLNKQ